MKLIKPTLLFLLLLIVACQKDEYVRPTWMYCNSMTEPEAIPNRPLQGIVYGKEVKGLIGAYMDLHGLYITQQAFLEPGNKPSGRSRMEIWSLPFLQLHPDKEKSLEMLEGKTFNRGYGRDVLPYQDISSGVSDSFILEIKKLNGEIYKNDAINKNHEFTIKFGKYNNGKIPVKMYLCSSGLTTQVYGSFEVTVVGNTDPRPEY